jgi:hypothetical protein
LIEIENDTLYIGIGCNITAAPVIPSSGDNAGRQATCLLNHYKNDSDGITIRNNLANDIFRKVLRWGEGKNIEEDNTDYVIQQFEECMEFSPQIIRNPALMKLPENKVSDDVSVSSIRREVVPLCVNVDGSLRVWNVILYILSTATLLNS